ncbi:high mobility group box, partial [Metschnikowia bicuspidata]
RPRNAFILFRQKYHQSVFGKYSRRSNSEVSKQLGIRWRNLLPEEKEHWNQLAKAEKEMHQKLYPKYKYTP